MLPRKKDNEGISLADSYLRSWLKVMNNYHEIVKFRQGIRHGRILAHRFSSLPFRCNGCGSFLHTNKSDKRGYLTNDQFYWLLKNAISFHDIYCANCSTNDDIRLHQIITKNEYINELSFLHNKPTLYLHVIDVCDIEGSFRMDYYRQIHPESHILFVVNKIDLLPTEVTTLEKLDDTMKDFISHFGKWDAGQVADTVYVSCKYFFGVISLFKLLAQISLDRDVCIVGTSNSGKSSLFNLIQNVMHLSKIRNTKLMPVQSTVGNFPGTTCGVIRHPINTLYLLHGYRYLRSLVVKDKEVEKFNLDKEINNEFKYFYVDPNLKAEIFGYNPLKSTDKKRADYLELCLESNANDHILLHQANTIYSSRPRVNYLNPKHRFDHDKYSWMYDTPSCSDNTEREKLCAKYVFDEVSNNNNSAVECLRNMHIKLKPDSMVAVDDFMIIRIDKSVNLKKIIPKDEPSSNNESNHLDIFFFVPPKLSSKVHLLQKYSGEDLLVESKDYNFEFVGNGFSKTACEIELNGLGWMTILGPSGSLIKLKVSVLKNSIIPTIRTIPILKIRPKKAHSKPLLNKYFTEGNVHAFERKIEPCVKRHHEISFNQRQLQINELKDHLLQQKPHLQSTQHPHINPPEKIFNEIDVDGEFDQPCE